MSEFQYYEFQAIDRPLTEADKAYVSSLSSRVRPTANQAIFTYSYGDFRGKPEVVLARCFDAMLYLADFGCRQLMFRFPESSLDLETLEPYCVPNYLTLSLTQNFIILNIRLHEEDGGLGYWLTEDNDFLASLIPLREDLLRGDFRLLYLTWLAAAQFPLHYHQNDRPEPPIPANLTQLSPALQSFVDLFEIDTDLIEAAAVNSPTATPPVEPLKAWIAQLSEAECQRFLLKFAQGEAVRTELVQYLRQKFGQSQNSNPEKQGDRSIGQLLELATLTRENRLKKQATAEKAQKIKELEAIAPKASAIWAEILQLIEQKKPKSYDQAIVLLRQLQELANYQDNSAEFSLKIEQLQTKHKNRPGLLSRLKAARLT